jgi:predicted NBD/HSP70 family sugar kinase
MPRGKDPTRPSLDLLRRLSDEHVLGAVLDSGPASRADLAARTGLSKPTVGQSVARLVAGGVLVEGGPADHGGRGRVGTAVMLAPTAGCAVAVRAGATGLAAELLTADGRVVHRVDLPLTSPVPAARLRAGLRRAARRLLEASPGPVRAVAVSVADPVDRAGRTVHLPGGPFLLGDVDIPAALALDVPTQVDNDVNWSVIAERRLGSVGEVPDVLHVHLGVGLGAALVADGRLVRGSRGFAGEIAYAVTDPGGSRGRDPLAGSLLGRLSELGLLVPGGLAVDPERVERTLDRGGERAGRLLEAVVGAIRGACHLLDAGAVVLDGPWGRHPAVVEAVFGALESDPVVAADVHVATVDDGPLVGARLGALDALRAALVPAPST